MGDRIVDFLCGDVVKIHSDQLNEMKNIVTSNKIKKRYRICLHDSAENRQQEMYICVSKTDYDRPHKHMGISETHTIVEGKHLVILFDDDGKIKEYFILDRNNGYISCRINVGIYHMSIPLTDNVIFYEVKPGPFTAESNIFASWAPDGEDSVVAMEYVENIKRIVKV